MSEGKHEGGALVCMRTNLEMHMLACGWVCKCRRRACSCACAQTWRRQQTSWRRSGRPWSASRCEAGTSWLCAWVCLSSQGLTVAQVDMHCAHTHTQTHTLKLKHIHCARTLRRRACTGRWLHPLFCHRPFVLPPLFLPRFVLPQARAYIVCRPGLDTAVLRAAGGGSVCL